VWFGPASRWFLLVEKKTACRERTKCPRCQALSTARKGWLPGAAGSCQACPRADNKRLYPCPAGAAVGQYPGTVPRCCSTGSALRAAGQPQSVGEAAVMAAAVATVETTPRLAKRATSYRGRMEWEIGELAQTFNPGDSITRTTPTGQETVNLPVIAIGHLRQLVVAGAGGPIIGFHILPACVAVSSSSPVVLTAGTVVVTDQIQQAIYAAFVESYARGFTPLGKIIGVTGQGVKMELRVQGAISAVGSRLTRIATAMPQPGQILNGSHRP
jgi:hypothetical protein